jgi:hypothetical protein
MSKQNNVNTDFYKTGGREHTEGSDKGDPVEGDKQQMAQNLASQQGQQGSPNFIPGEAPVGQPGKSAKKNDEKNEKE